jgi:hypothetical protein
MLPPSHIERLLPFSPTSEDHLFADVPMPLRQVFYPLGFPVELITNSPQVLEAASQSWNIFVPKFETPPLTLKLGVTKNPVRSSLPPTPITHIQRHLMTHIADRHNYLCCDLNIGFSFGWVTEETAQNTLYLRYHFIEAAALCMLSAMHVASLHAACISSHGYGMLLCGDSGAGKSSLAFAAAQAGWTFTSDDASYLLLNRQERMVVGNCYQFRLRDTGALLFPELEGRQITPRAAGKPSIEIPTVELPEVKTAISATVRAIIFLNRKNVLHPELLPFSQEATQELFHQSHYTNPAFSAQRRKAIDHLLEVPVYEIRYTDLAWAIARLDQLAQQGG